MPAVFHDEVGFVEFLKKLKEGVPEETYHHLELFALVVGLAIRDINFVMVHESDEVLPDWVATSVLKDEHVDLILKYCPPKIADTSQASQ